MAAPKAAISTAAGRRVLLMPIQPLIAVWHGEISRAAGAEGLVGAVALAPTPSDNSKVETS